MDCLPLRTSFCPSLFVNLIMASAKLGFVGRVAVITGAGGGLGKAYALEFAKRGASVVVNDLGGSFKGEGKGTQLADQVVKEITDAGGKAVANYDSVEDGEKIIETAIMNFGKVDIVINNAGILRDRSFLKITEADWNKVFQVHVHGAFKVTKAAWPHMRKQKYGRIVMTTSPAGLYGNFGQSNYSAAKMALLGLANTLSIEGEKSNIQVNTIAPLASTRMTEDILPIPLYPEDISPYVVYLCHESCEENGSLVEVAGGFACKTRLQRSQGAQLRQFVADHPTVEKVASSWHKLSDFNFPSYVSSATQATEAILRTTQDLPEKPMPGNATAYEKMTLCPFPDTYFEYGPDDIIRYALSVGATLPDDHTLLYEGHSQFSALPTFSAIVSQQPVFGKFVEGIPGMEEIDITKAVHGEQYTELFKPFPSNGCTLTNKTRIVDVLDKRKFCQVILENDVVDEAGDTISRNQFVVLFLGSNGIGKRGKSEFQISPLPPPKRAPDAVYEEKTSLTQAALYRLNGDKNPLHIDESVSSMMGFSAPILHGLCTYGYALRHILKTYGEDNTAAIKSIKAQFSKPVIPGQTLVTEMWQEGRRVFYQTKVKETNAVVIKGGYVDFNVNIKQSAPAGTQDKSSGQQEVTSSQQQVTSSTGDASLKATHIIKEIETRISSVPDLIKQIKGSFLFQITKANKLAGEWLFNFNQTPAAILYNPSNTSKPDVTIKLDDSDFESLALGKLNPMTAFMQGKLKATGKIMLAQKLGDLFKSHASKL